MLRVNVGAEKMKKIILILIAVALLGALGWFALRHLALARAVPHGGTPRGRCTRNLAQLGKAMVMYEMDHSNQWPTAWGDLVPAYITQPRGFRCPVAKGEMGSITNIGTWTAYRLVALPADSAPDRVHAFCPPENHGGEGAIVLFPDCSVIWVSTDEFEEMIRDQALTEVRQKHQQHAGG